MVEASSISECRRHPHVSIVLKEPPERIAPPLALHRFTVKQYHEMIRLGVLTENDRVELIEGWVIDKMPQHPAHAGATSVLQRELTARVPAGWVVRVQFPVTLGDSEPEPDLAVVRGPEERYFAAHPTIEDIALVVEVADSSLDQDRTHKLGVYAAARVPIYWVVNLLEFTVECYTEPRGSARPNYAVRQVYGVEFGVPLNIMGKRRRGIPVARLFPAE
jgi:Uma2 family endonuclease